MQKLPWTKSTSISIESTPNFNLSSEEETKLTSLWDMEQKRCQGNLFNGQIFHVVEVSSSTIRGYFVEYRYLVGFQRDEALRKRLDLHTLGVSGLVFNQDGDLLFGKRAPWTLTFGSYYELVPSGGVDPLAQEGKILNIHKQFTLELEEETGIVESQIAKIELDSLLIKKEENIMEVIGKIHLNTQVNIKPTSEYPELFWVKTQDIPHFIETNKSNIIPFTVDILTQLNMI